MSFSSEWINKLWYTQTMEYKSALKISELLSHEKTWRSFKCILLSERNPSEKATYSMIPITWHGKDKTVEMVESSMVSRGRIEGRQPGQLGSHSLAHS